MEYRSLQVAAGLIVLLSLGNAAWAAKDGGGPDPEQQADWQRRLIEAKAMQKRGGAEHKAAADRFEAEKTSCFKEFRVNDCQNEAKQRYVAAVKESRRQENEGKALERQIKKEQLGDKDARRLEEAPRRDADLKEREAATRDEREATEAQRTERAAGKETKAAEGERRRLDNDARIAEKRGKHERQVAEKLEKARRRAAEAAD